MEIRVNRIGRNGRGRGTGGDIGGGGGGSPPPGGGGGQGGFILTIRAETLPPILGTGEYCEVVCTTIHNLVGGETVEIAGSPNAAYNGTHLDISIKNGNTFAIQEDFTTSAFGGTWTT